MNNVVLAQYDTELKTIIITAMTHLQRLLSDHIKQIETDKYFLLKSNGEKYLPGEPVIFQATDKEEEKILRITGVTHSVPGLMKNWIIISLEENE